MEIGYAQEAITPSLVRPVYLAGFGHNRLAQSVHDDLFVRAVSINDGQTVLVLCALDLIGLFKPDILEITHRVQAQAPGIRSVIACTHTHHGPDTAGLWGPGYWRSGVDAEYMTQLKLKAEKTILAALENPRPVSSMKNVSVFVHGVAKNARDPGILDEQLIIMQFLGEDRKPLISLYNFACHPEVLWEHNPHITSDYPGALRLEVEAQTNAPCIFFSGALGGMMTPDVKDHSFEEAIYMGKKLAQEGLSALAVTNEIPPPVISIQKRKINVQLTNILYKLAFRLKTLPDGRDKDGQLETEVNLIKLGETWFATVPGELLPKLGLELKTRMVKEGARMAGIIGLANDWLGYILPADDFKYPLNPFNPRNHYEETNSIGKDIGPKVVGALNEIIASL